jgi:hypothetical protein
MKKFILICIVWLISLVNSYGQKYIGMTYAEARSYISSNFYESDTRRTNSGDIYIYGIKGDYMIAVFFDDGICNIWRSCLKGASYQSLKSTLVSLNYINIGNNIFIQDNIIAKITYEPDLKEYVVTMITND